MFKSQTPRFPQVLLALAVLVLLASCATVEEAPPVAPAEATPPVAICPVCPVCQQCPAPQITPVAPPVVQAAKPMRAVTWDELPGWGEDDLLPAWPGFLRSCQALESNSQWLLWRAACDEARAMHPVDSASLRKFFEARFTPYQLINPDGTTKGTITGYYEPLLRGSRTRSAQYSQPVLGVPPDLLTVDLSEVAPDVKNIRLRGRLQGNRVVPYYSRAEIVAKETAFADRVLLWVDDAVELFFLQIQGSGRVRLPDGTLVRIGYADQNGHPYRSVGRVLIDRGELTLQQASMQGIQAWARTHPAQLDALLNTNPSYVFFREVPTSSDPDEGPQGALGVPLIPLRSVAIDPRTVPLGAPIFLATTQPNTDRPLRRLVLAQDTGGAIRGVVRADFFWGFGPEAGALAGRMKQEGQMWVLLPPGVAPR